MDSDTVVLSSNNGGKAAYSTSCDKNGNSIKFNNSGDSQEGNFRIWYKHLSDGLLCSEVQTDPFCTELSFEAATQLLHDWSEEFISFRPSLTETWSANYPDRIIHCASC